MCFVFRIRHCFLLTLTAKLNIKLKAWKNKVTNLDWTLNIKLKLAKLIFILKMDLCCFLPVFKNIQLYTHRRGEKVRDTSVAWHNIAPVLQESHTPFSPLLQLTL